MRHSLPLILTTALVVTACEPAPSGDPASYGAVLPDDRLLINLPAEGGGDRRDGELSEGWRFTAQATRDVNGLIGAVLGSVHFLVTTYPPTWHDAEAQTAVWGPWSDPLEPFETVLLVHREADESHSWAVARRPRGEASWDAFTEIVVGQVEPGATATVSQGWFYLDFDAAAELDPLATARGRFATTYDLREDGVSATSGFEDFSDQGEEIPEAWYAYDQLHGGGGSMDLAWYADINPESGTGNLEGHVVRSRWQADGAGRADMVIGGGDLETMGVVGLASDCWGTDFYRDYYAANWDPSLTEGEESACVFAEPLWPEEEESEAR